MPGHDRALFDQSGHRPAVRIGLPGHHRHGHGEDRAGVSRRARHQTACGGRRRIAWRHAGVRMGRPVSGSGRCDRRDRQHARVAAPGRRLERDRAQRHHGRSCLAGWPLLRHRAKARRRDGRRANGRPHHVPVGEIAGRQVRQAAAVCGRHPLHPDRSGVRGRKLPAPPGRLVREALRRQHLSLYLSSVDLFRSRAAVRQWQPGRGASWRVGAHAADCVQLRLAVSAGRVPRSSPTRFVRSARMSSCT